MSLRVIGLEIDVLLLGLDWIYAVLWGMLIYFDAPLAQSPSSGVTPRQTCHRVLELNGSAGQTLDSKQASKLNKKGES